MSKRARLSLSLPTVPANGPDKWRLYMLRSGPADAFSYVDTASNYQYQTEGSANTAVVTAVNTGVAPKTTNNFPSGSAAAIKSSGVAPNVAPRMDGNPKTNIAGDGVPGNARQARRTSASTP